MSGGTITGAVFGAIIQAIPTTALACIAGLGFYSWERQIREPRKVKRAEACLIAAYEFVDLVHACRSNYVSVPGVDFLSSPDEFKAALDKQRRDILERTWISWRTFAATYRRIGFYLTVPGSDISEQFSRIISELSSISAVMSQLEPLDKDSNPLFHQHREQLVAYR